MDNTLYIVKYEDIGLEMLNNSLRINILHTKLWKQRSTMMKAWVDSFILYREYNYSTIA